jgi:LacI family transcriptional regulator
MTAMDTLAKKKIRLVDIAAMAKVSVPTASLALANSPEINADTCKRVQMISKKLGYLRPGERHRWLEQKIPEQKSLRFGFLLVGRRLNDEVMTSMLHAMSIEASSLKIRLELKAIEDITSSEALKDQVVDFVRELDGVIVEGLVDSLLLNLIETSHIPYVVVGNMITQPGEIPPIAGHFVDWNVQAMGQLAAGRLLACGHQRIGFFCEKIFRGLWNYRWLMGYHDAHWEAGISPDKSLVHISEEILVGGKPAADYFCSLENPPTAYICPDIRVAASFIDQMNRYGIRISPETLFLGGLPEIAPKYHMEAYPLIGQEVDKIGKIAIEYLLQLHENPGMSPRFLQIPFITQNFIEPATVRKL